VDARDPTVERPFAWYEDVLATDTGRRASEVERLLREATENLARLMQHQGVTGRELARRLEVSPSRVSQMLDGTRNLTLSSLAEAFHALGRSLHLTHGPPTERVRLTGLRTRRKKPLQKPRRSR
jgi:antitoxin component HigA of HigAB toxin-antitoxin module